MTDHHKIPVPVPIAAIQFFFSMVEDLLFDIKPGDRRTFELELLERDGLAVVQNRLAELDAWLSAQDMAARWPQILGDGPVTLTRRPGAKAHLAALGPEFSEQSK